SILIAPKKFNRHLKKQIIVKPIHSSLRSESKIRYFGSILFKITEEKNVWKLKTFTYNTYYYEFYYT
ncbi:hypothetical protein FWK35_00019001, partial [Aphis craccivora]